MTSFTPRQNPPLPANWEQLFAAVLPMNSTPWASATRP